MSDVSVLTICAGRRDHLVNVIKGLCEQEVPPSELVIGVMQDELYRDLPRAGFPIRQIAVPPGSEGLPLAHARNEVANAARGDLLVFVDVDCIPSRRLIADYAEQARSHSGLFMGEVRYLPAHATDAGIDEARFKELSVRHSDRRGPPEEGVEPCRDYRCFWSLNFAMRAQDWRQSGGFDERFVGYGGEDTDFGKTLAEKGMPIWWQKGARVYHQYHAHCMPPIHHMRSVIRNAELFAEKWGYRTMEHWLHAFRLLGLIRNTPGGLEIMREPGPEDFELCRQQAHQPYANTRKVIDMLEQRHCEGADELERQREVARAEADMIDIAAE
ncbi:glycosyltransferase family 2 protein [Sulfitobacter aestuarii]|uniref:Glycosyltransferase family 2 protein n=1 Tax=Sulfitobacter aestuarii TaxID=2161676 RepID=A0ABW5U6U1_9RHOB